MALSLILTLKLTLNLILTLFRCFMLFFEHRPMIFKLASFVRFFSPFQYGTLAWFTDFYSTVHHITLGLSFVSRTCPAGEHSTLPTPTVCGCRRSDCHLLAAELFRLLHLIHVKLSHLLIQYTLSGTISRPIFFSNPFWTSLCHLSGPCNSLLYLSHCKKNFRLDYGRLDIEHAASIAYTLLTSEGLWNKIAFYMHHQSSCGSSMNVLISFDC